MKDTGDFSFGVLRLLLFTAAVGAAFALARVLPEMVFAPVLMSGIAVSLIVLVAKRRDLRRIASLLFAVFLGILALAGIGALVWETSPEGLGVALVVALVIVVFAHGWLRGAD